MKILLLALKDIKQIFRDRRAALFLVAMPMLFTVFMGIAFGGGHPAAAPVRLAWVDPQPDQLLNHALFVRVEQSQSVVLFAMASDVALKAWRRGDVLGVIVVPSDFSDRILRGGTAPLVLIADPASQDGRFLDQVLRVHAFESMASIQIARLAGILQDQEPSVLTGISPVEQAGALEETWRAWGELRSLTRLELLSEQTDRVESESNPYNRAAPGTLVQFAVFGLVTSAQILVQERRAHTLQRLMTTMQPWHVLAGHLLAMFLVWSVQAVLLIAFGQWILRVDYLRQPLELTILTVALGIWVASLGLLIGVYARAEDQVVLYAMIAMLVSTGMSGVWFSFDGSGSLFAVISRLTPAAWAVRGYEHILLHEAITPAWLPATALMGYGISFFLLAVFSFRHRRSLAI